jgi:CTP:molybdopterin cytidylyltransferase MocA
LRAGLDALASVHPPADAALVMLVDLPGVGAEVVQRVLSEAATSVGDATRVLCRAAYRGEPGHPVLIGSAHWADVIATATGDAGARGYLAGRDVRLVECGDLASGRDVDTGAGTGAGAAADTGTEHD